MLESSKLPVRMAGVSLSAALYAAEGFIARNDLGVEDMESRIKAQVNESGISHGKSYGKGTFGMQTLPRVRRNPGISFASPGGSVSLLRRRGPT